MKLNNARRTELVDDLRTAYENMRIEWADFESVVGDAREQLNEKIAEYNSLLEQAKSFVTEHVEEAQEVYDNKSEGWQEGDKGQALQQWIDDLSQFDPSDIDEIEEIECPFNEDDCSAADDLESLEDRP